ncbi:MAG: DUF445 family protein [Clostridia bacterium]|nr:DUF445 family protein [Clostridia bacterium]
MEILRILAGPIIGAVIGYCTNYIAVKMLFRPYRPIKVFGKTLPFTPGIIPKRQPDLARAVGKAVGDNLFGEVEIKGILQSDEVKNTIIGGITDSIENAIDGETVRGTIMKLASSEESYDNKKDTIADFLSVRIIEGIKSLDIAEIITKQGTSAIKQMGGMLAMFVNESMVSSMAGPISEKFVDYLEGEGYFKIHQLVENEINEIEGWSMDHIIGEHRLDKIRTAISDLYDKMLGDKIADILNAFDVEGIVEEKIVSMDVEELETLILSVMKHELGMIVNLGALIGMILGLINLLVL